MSDNRSSSSTKKWLDFYFMEEDGSDFNEKISPAHRNAYLLTRKKLDDGRVVLTLYYIDENQKLHPSEITSQDLASKSLFANFLQRIDDTDDKKMTSVDHQLKEEEKNALNNKLKQAAITERPLAVNDQLAYEFTKFNIQKVKDHLAATDKKKSENDVIAAGPLNKSNETWAMEMLLAALLRQDPADPIDFNFQNKKITAIYKGVEYDLNQILPYVNWSQIKRFSDDPEIQNNYRDFLSGEALYRPDRPAKKIPGMWETPDPTKLSPMPQSDSDLEDNKLSISLEPVRRMFISKKRGRKNKLVLRYKIKNGDKIKNGYISIKKLRTLMKKYNDEQALKNLDAAIQSKKFSDWNKINAYIFHFTPITGSKSEYIDHILKNIKDNDTGHELDHLNDAEKIALNIYSSNAAYDMNNLLRCNYDELLTGADARKKNAAVAELFRHVAMAAPACYANRISPDNGEVKTYVRRLEVGPGKEHLLKDILAKAESATVHRVPETAFQSTTTNESKYTNILEKKYAAIVFSNTVPGVNIRALSIYPEEIEYLLAPGIGGLVYENVAQTDDSYIVAARIVDTPTDLPTPATPFALNDEVQQYKIKQMYGSQQAYYLTRTAEEQYENNVNAWRAFLSEDPQINPHSKDEGYQERQDTMRKFFALLDYVGLGVEDISHGGRVRLQSEDMETIVAELTKQKNVIDARSAASHKTAHDKRQNEYKERQLRGGFKALLDVHHYARAFMNNEHWGMDIGVSADARAMPADGSHGHVYLNIFHPKGRKNGALLLGVEGAAPRKKNQFGEHHGAKAKVSVLSATGATKRKESKTKQKSYVRPDEPFIRVDNVAEALAYIESNYKHIENKWLGNLADEEKRLAAIKNERAWIAAIEAELDPKWESEYSTNKLSHFEIHEARAARILEMSKVSKNPNLQSLENAKTKNQAMIAELEKYIETVSNHPAEFIQKAEERLQSLASLNQAIDHCLTSKPRNYGYVTAARAFTTNHYEEAVRKKNAYLANENSPCSVAISSNTGKAVTSNQYAVTSAKHGELESVTIHTHDKNNSRAEIYFKDPAKAAKRFKADRQNKKGGAVVLPFLPPLGSNIPGQAAMAWAADTIDAFLAASGGATHIQCSGATREQAEAIQIYTAFLSRQNPSRPIQCDVPDGFTISEEKLNKKVDLYINLTKKDVMLHKSMEQPHSHEHRHVPE